MGRDDKSKMQPPHKRLPMDRPGLASRGGEISLLTNHLKVSISKTDNDIYQYSVSIKHKNGTPVDTKGMGRTIINKLQESEFGAKNFVFDGEKDLFTIGSVPKIKFNDEFIVIIDDGSSNWIHVDEGNSEGSDKKRIRREPHSKTYKVAISYAKKIPIHAIANAKWGRHSEQFQEAVRVLDIILRQNAVLKGCLIVSQSFFHNEPNNFVDIGGGVLGCRGFRSSFRETQGGLSLNMDVSTTMIVKPGPVIDFLLFNQNVKFQSEIDWDKAKRTLKNLRIKFSTTGKEHKISGLSDLSCKDQMFLFKQRREGATDATEVEISVYDYFVKHRKIPLKHSGDFPCINVGKQKKATYLPVELCSLVSLQRYTNALTNLQRSALVEGSRRKPQDRMNDLRQALASSNYAADSLLQSCGISVSDEFNRVEGRVLPPPKLKVGKNEDFVPSNGRWNFNNKHVFKPIAELENWAAVSFSDYHNEAYMRSMCERLINCGINKGISIKQSYNVFEEDFQYKGSPATTRVDRMIEKMKDGLTGNPQFILCILPERKNSNLYGPWKRKNLTELGIFTQCIAPPRHTNDQYLTNVLLKINAKLGGMNSVLSIERSSMQSIVCGVPTMIIGMHVSHGSPGRDVPSIAAVVSSREWPLISQYRASIRLQSPRSAIIESLFKPISDTKDQGIFRELMDDFQESSKMKPEQIIIFRDGVSESQFVQVLNIELDQIIKACKFKDGKWNPKFMLVVAQKNHHTKFFQSNSLEDNVPPGTVIDSGVCHPKRNDFYMCAHAGMIGTTRPTHYHVLHNEINFSPDDLQEFVHSLSYVYQRSTNAISVVAPIRYAHLAAAQMFQFVKFEEGSSDRASTASEGGLMDVPQLPRLDPNICNSMFFC